MPLFLLVTRYVGLVTLTAFFHVTAFPQVVIHPTSENIPDPSDPRFELRHGLDGDESWEWDSLEMSSIGVNEGSLSQMLGFVFDLKTDHNGTIYYFDIVHQEVRAYDYRGNWISSVGSPGTGPGELASPLGLAVVSERNQVIIADQFINHIFERKDSSFQLVATQRPIYPSINGRMCAMDEHYYLVSFNNTETSSKMGLIHKYTLEGEWVTSFGNSYDYDDPFVVSEFAYNTSLACNSEYQTIAFVTRGIPAMTGYSDQGEKLWQVTFPGHRPITTKEHWENGRKYLTENRDDGTSAFGPLFSDGEYFYVVYVFAQKESRFHFFSKPKLSGGHAFRVHAQTGLGIYLGSSGPEPGEILRAIDGEYRFTTTETSGFPQIRIYKSQ
ncbi:MAG: hypothetical protein F4065_09585 [Rhodothermaceae bacterium]|nr:hypothetical protein [Rhodothermaceae bacterium]MXX96974.1 hypothetical protein [Rhodothermaceae bacterium]MXZ57232.1 hypothetical protein [Rhodothermaceae bacterium]MYB90928.1 hypothetical protein [Rhodothermaceae bacterium]MYC03518.1 hypothetical protein [Rhodothermaceae bacterium]